MSISYTALQTEITTDPAAIGYAGKTDAQVAALLNTVRSGTAPDGKSYTIFRNDIAPKEVVNCIEAADFTAATQLVISKLELLFVAAPIDATLANVRTNFSNLFSGASATTRTALAAVAQRNGSRAEVLFGTGVSITEADIGIARNGQ